jgi:hypothetical protein
MLLHIDEDKFFYATNFELTSSKINKLNLNYKFLFGRTLPSGYGTARFLYNSKDQKFQFVYGKKMSKDYVLKIFARW